MSSNVEAPHFVEEPREYLLKMDKALKMPLGLEYVVVVEVGGEKFEACVPASTIYNDDPPVVSSSMVGTQGKYQLVVFSPSSLGTAIWHLTEEMLESMRYTEHPT